jgi:hypothetical protein
MPRAPPASHSEENLMPRFIIERFVPGLTREELMAAGRRSVLVLAELPDVRWIRSFVSDVEGKIYCEYDAPSIEAIREHARRAGLPADRISEVALEVNPTMFM